MPRASSRRTLSAIDTLTTTPPTTLPPTHIICRIITSAGNNIYRVTTSADTKADILVELPTLFRGKVWLKRGGYVVVDTNAFEGRENKLGGEVINIVRDENVWRKEGYWPNQFPKVGLEDSDDENEEESTMGKITSCSENGD